MFKRIVAAYDGSDQAIKALNTAIELAKAFNSKLDVVEVVDTAALLGMGFAPIPSDVIAQIYSKAQNDVEQAKKKAQEAGVKDVTSQVLEGDPATSIIEYASKNGADLIVMGSRGLSTFKRLVLGSVSSKVVQESRIPVLVVK
ncbi:MAG: universal stress protein [Sulfolobales archaeon]|nr:universal stress protein [Sulfolobales archaeon]MCG2907646.1 universal stress protein [Sulfolobales archaeon]